MVSPLRRCASSPYATGPSSQSRFTIDDDLPEGGRGAGRIGKFRALDNETGCEVVWNAVSVAHCDRRRVDSILSDLRSASQLSCKFLDRVLAFWHNPAEQQVIYITDSPSAESLFVYLRKIKSPRLKVVKQWTKDLLTALAQVHAAGWAHGHFGLHAILIVPSSGEVKLGGVGLSALESEAVPMEYCAPEVLQGRAGPKADVYALGICLLEIATLSKPFAEHVTTAELQRCILSHDPPMALVRLQQPLLADLIRQCLRPEAERPSAGALLAHPFLALSDELPECHLPIQVLPVVPPLRPISVLLTFLSPALRVEFDFREGIDTVDSVARELSEELSIPASQFCCLHEALSTRIACRRKSVIRSEPDLLKATDLSKLEERQKQELISLRNLHQQEIHALLQRKAQQSQSCCFDSRQPASRPCSCMSTTFNDSKDLFLKESRCSSGSASPNETTKDDKTPPIQIPDMRTACISSTHGEESDIRKVQEALNVVSGEERCKVDGVYGGRTEVLVKEFQANSGLLVDGVVTKPVWKLLLSNFHSAESEKQRCWSPPSALSPPKPQTPHENTERLLTSFEHKIMETLNR